MHGSRGEEEERGLRGVKGGGGDERHRREERRGEERRGAEEGQSSAEPHRSQFGRSCQRLPFDSPGPSAPASCSVLPRCSGLADGSPPVSCEAATATNARPVSPRRAVVPPLLLPPGTGGAGSSSGAAGDRLVGAQVRFSRDPLRLSEPSSGMSGTAVESVVVHVLHQHHHVCKHKVSVQEQGGGSEAAATASLSSGLRDRAGMARVGEGLGVLTSRCRPGSQAGRLWQGSR